VSSGWKVDPVIKIGIVGVIKNEEPALLSTRESLKGIRNALDRMPKNLCNSNEVAFSSRRPADVDPEYSPKPVVLLAEIIQTISKTKIKHTLLAFDLLLVDKSRSSLAPLTQ
jgi:hypothetical protein